MVQELIDLRKSILEGRCADALVLLDELDGMSKKAILRAIESFIIRLLVHLIKNQVEQRLTNSGAASIRGSIIEISKLNLKENKKSYYINQSDWIPILEESLEIAVSDASVEVLEGCYSPFQLTEMVNREEVLAIAKDLLAFTYNYPIQELPKTVNNYLSQLSGGEDWKLGKRL